MGTLESLLKALNAPNGERNMQNWWSQIQIKL